MPSTIHASVPPGGGGASTTPGGCRCALAAMWPLLFVQRWAWMSDAWAAERAMADHNERVLVDLHHLLRATAPPSMRRDGRLVIDRPPLARPASL